MGTAERPDLPAEAAHIGQSTICSVRPAMHLTRPLIVVDLTPEGATRRAKRHLTKEEADTYLNENWRLRIVK